MQFFRNEQEKLDFMAELEMIGESEFREEIELLEAKITKQNVELDRLKAMMKVLMLKNGVIYKEVSP